MQDPWGWHGPLMPALFSINARESKRTVSHWGSEVGGVGPLDICYLSLKLMLHLNACVSYFGDSPTCVGSCTLNPWWKKPELWQSLPQYQLGKWDWRVFKSVPKKTCSIFCNSVLSSQSRIFWKISISSNGCLIWRINRTTPNKYDTSKDNPLP